MSCESLASLSEGSSEKADDPNGREVLLVATLGCKRSEHSLGSTEKTTPVATHNTPLTYLIKRRAFCEITGLLFNALCCYS